MYVFVLTLVGAAILASVFLFGHRLVALERYERFRLWIAFAEGASIAYVLLHLIPHIAADQEHVAETFAGLFGWHDLAVYTVVLAGVVVFYGIRTLTRAPVEGKGTDRQVALSSSFLAGIASFSILNLAATHALHQRAELGADMLLGYVLAIGLHYGVIDDELGRMHGSAYVRFGRWPLILAVIAGWLLGYVVELERGGFIVLLAFVSGSVILNTMKQELPDNAAEYYAAFVVGAVTYGSAVLLFL